MNGLLNAVDWLFRHTLRSVVFGIVLLVLIAIYVAVGSGLPGVREYFEVDELGFFNAWPLKLLMILMVANLTTVTIQRIPFTPPRYGVWMVHVGIVTLIAGMGFYYGQKVEGSALIIKGRTQQKFYDRYERSLYFQAGGAVAVVPLPSLPRFHTYSNDLGNVDYLDRGDLKNIIPVVAGAGTTAADSVGAKALNFQITGYWPYAFVRDRVVVDPKVNRVGFAFDLPDAATGGPARKILSAGLPKFVKVQWGDADIEHRELADQAAIDALIDRTKKAHTLTLKVGDFKQTFHPAVGDVIQLGDTKYGLRIESFDPQWQTIDKKILPKLTFLVASPTQTYRRMVLSGDPKPTDFKLGEAGAGPMGKRQTTPLDAALEVTYAYDPAAGELPTNGLGRVLFLTTPNSNKTTVVSVEANGPVTVQTFDGEDGHVDLQSPQTEEATLAASMGRPMPRDTAHVDVKRTDHADSVQSYVDEVPKEKRNREEGTSGRRQVIEVKYDGVDSEGKPFSGTTLTPFSEHPYETPWTGGMVNVPNATGVGQIQLGNTRRWMPAIARLDKLEAIAYGGIDPQAGAMIRDYRSTITLTDPRNGQARTDTVYLNSPVFYANNNWIFFQSAFDIQNQQWTVLGVGNRPGVYTMTGGCVLIVVGIFYAFYIKPVLIKRMKNKAIENAKKSKAPKNLEPAGAGA